MYSPLMNKLFPHNTTFPVEEGLFTKYWAHQMKVSQAGHKLVQGSKADKRDTDVKIVLIAECNLKDKVWNKPLFAWNPDDYKHIAVYYGVARQYSGIQTVDANKKLVITSEKFWSEHADDKILVFKVKREDCNKGKNIITDPMISWIYTTKKDKLKTQFKVTTVRKIIKEMGYKVSTPWHGPTKPGKELKI